MTNMASSHILCHNNVFNLSPNPFRNRGLSSLSSNGSCSFASKRRFSRTSLLKSVVSERRQVEIVYHPDKRINNLADEVDKEAPLSRLTLFSPCKINVFLRITNKREDGYHDLASLFHVISLGDILKFSLSPSTRKDSLSTNAPGVPLDDRNLIIKALNLYRKKTGTSKYFWKLLLIHHVLLQIHLDKKVPTGAGLGGGSSNAATALWAANQFNGCLVSEKELQEWSSEIGSDIPFFFSNGAAYCTGRGEVVQDILPPVPLNIPMVLVKPSEACSTAEVYKRLQLDKTSKVDPLQLLDRISVDGISQDLCINDLEPPAFEVLPSLKRLKQRIIAASRGQYDAVFMSGSGSTIVGIGSPDPPQFIYDDDDYKDVFLSEANFLTREVNQWYKEPASASACNPSDKFSRDFSRSAEFILTKRCPPGQGLVGAAMLQLYHGQQISSMDILFLRRNCKNVLVRLVQIFLSFSPKGQPVVLVEVVQDILPPVPLNIPMVLIKPPEACSTAEVYKVSNFSRHPHLIIPCFTCNVFVSFEVLPSLKRLEQRIIAASRGQYDEVFMSGSGSTIVGIGSLDPPQFIDDDDDYKDVFSSEANFLTREVNQWYKEPASASACSPSDKFSCDFSRSVE
ncbi:4-diphosphocytidyl-2C-methyl-D-erythritol kinase [Parasponia andersonii]|uniref:4-(cytidine 5'-diphospho)-2-C-methyl-D-erythritol kinase n=1 Tax=Parasponia andersonii TaxID=3476 RepID=A0A2P5CDS8_PARAD|nr:4-diphosphocytidyl-2C-methyl-D-erythritol kinase [Parasponia andersonii]